MSDTLVRTGAQIQRQMAVMRARCIARYRMHSVPGRPEELERSVETITALPRAIWPQTTANRTISFGYGCGMIRIRKHGGPTNREWIETRDILIKDGWLANVYEFLDQWMGYAPAPEPILLSIDVPPRPRPIKDNPQA